MHALILTFALLSEWIYDPHHKPWPVGEEYHPVVYNRRVALVASRDNNTCIVVHRGTASADDIYYDILAELDGTCVDGGDYLEAFKESYDDESHDLIYNAIPEVGCYDIYSTGHSLGGVTAIIAYKTKLSGLVNTVVTFGSPKMCCGEDLVADDNILRVTNKYDPVPALPMHLKDNVFHCGKKVYYPDTREWDDEDYLMDFPKFPHGSFLQHRIARYIMMLQYQKQDYRMYIYKKLKDI